MCKMIAYEEKLLLCQRVPVLKVLEGHQHEDIDVSPTVDGVGLEIIKVGHDASRRSGGEKSAWGGVMYIFINLFINGCTYFRYNISALLHVFRIILALVKIT